MTPSLLISVSPGEVWAVLTDKDGLAELRVLREDGSLKVGEVVLGRVVAVKPELPAALVEIGEARPAFLSADDAGGGIASLREGEALLVQVSKAARADKATGLRTRIRLEATLLDFVPGGAASFAKGFDEAARQRIRDVLPAGIGFRIHTAADAAAPATLSAEAEALAARWQAIEQARTTARAPARLEPSASAVIAALLDFAELPSRIVTDDRAAFAEARRWLARRGAEAAGRLALHDAHESLFERENVAEAIEAALSPRVMLPGGGALSIEATAAAVTIDVDSGGAPLMATNLAAARAIARQVRLRNLAGAIVIDFIAQRDKGRDKAQRARVTEALERGLAGDDTVQFLGWTRLGHFELTRKRRHPALDEVIFERGDDGGRIKTTLTVALEALRALAREARARPALVPALVVAPEVATALADGAARAARLALESQLGRPIAIHAEPGRPRARFDIGAA